MVANVSAVLGSGVQDVGQSAAAAAQAFLEQVAKQRQQAFEALRGSSPAQIAEALQGKNAAIGNMSDAEKRDLVGASLDAWDAQSTGWNNRANSQTGLRNAADLRTAVQGDPQLAGLVKSVYDSKPLNAVIYYNNDAPRSDPNNSFDKAAYTYGRQHGGNSPDVYMPVLKVADFKDAWRNLAESGRPVVGAAYLGHGGVENNSGVLYFKGEQMSATDVSQLARANYAPNASIELHVCNGAKGNAPTAQSLANSQGVPVAAESGKSYFSTSESKWNTDYYWDRGGAQSNPNWNGDLYLGAYDHDINCNAWTELGCSWDRLPQTQFAPQRTNP